MLLGNGDGTFQTAAAFAAGDGPFSVAVADLDGDTAPDLVAANFDSYDVSVLLNQAPEPATRRGRCALGFELALLLPPLMWLHHRRRGRFRA